MIRRRISLPFPDARTIVTAKYPLLVKDLILHCACVSELSGIDLIQYQEFLLVSRFTPFPLGLEADVQLDLLRTSLCVAGVFCSSVSLSTNNSGV